MALRAHELITRPVSHRRDSGAEGSPSRVPTTFLQITVIATAVVALLVLPEVIIHAVLVVWSATATPMRIPTVVVVLLVLLMLM